MQHKMVETAVSGVPSGTVYLVASLQVDKGPPYALNIAHVNKGKTKVIKAAGERFSTGAIKLTSPSGKRVIIDPNSAVLAPHILSVVTGEKILLKADLARVPGNIVFYGFSPQERYLSYAWDSVYKEIVGRGRSKSRDIGYGGMGIYDSQTQQTWQEEGATLAAWSVSGDQLVFGRYYFKGNYLRGYENESLFSPPGFFKRSPAALLNDLHLFRKDIRRLREPGAERITSVQATHLVGAWHHPALLYAVQKEPGGLRVLGGNIVAPRGRGIVFTDSRNTFLNPNDEVPWLNASDNALEWSTQYLDAQGRTALYKPSPPIFPISWSRDGERLYGWTQDSTIDAPVGNAFICFWSHSGKYAQISLPEGLGTIISYIEN